MDELEKIITKALEMVSVKPEGAVTITNVYWGLDDRQIKLIAPELAKQIRDSYPKDAELKKKIITILQLLIIEAITKSDIPHTFNVPKYVDDIHKIYLASGYIKKPTGEPPILSDEEIMAAWDDDFRVELDHPLTPEDVLLIRLKLVAKAQIAACKKHCEGK
jgi:hypothetical protein